MKALIYQMHTRLEFVPHITSSSLFGLFTGATVLHVSASFSEARDDIIPVKCPAVQVSGCASLRHHDECRGLYITAQCLLLEGDVCASSQLESSG